MPKKLQLVACVLAFAALMTASWWARNRRNLRASALHHYPVYYTPHGTLE